MKLRKASPTNRAFAMLYGDTGTGKTVSTLLSCPRPALYLETEERPVERCTQGVVDMEGVTIAHPENYIDLYQYLTENFNSISTDYKTVFIDSFTFLMNVTLLGEIEEETGRAEVFDKKKRPLVDMGRTDQTGYGSMSSLMKRLCRILGRIATQGCLVVCTALQADMPKWNRELSAAPALAGREFPRDMAAYFDLIGRVETRKDEDGNVIYPPRVYFRSDDSDFLAKWSGPPIEQSFTILDWEKILAYKGNGK